MGHNIIGAAQLVNFDVNTNLLDFHPQSQFYLDVEGKCELRILMARLPNSPDNDSPPISIPPTNSTPTK